MCAQIDDSYFDLIDAPAYENGDGAAAPAPVDYGDTPGDFPAPEASFMKQMRPSVSGTWYGETQTQGLELRIDIDRMRLDTPVMRRVSGDFVEIRRLAGIPIRAYRDSWIVDAPTVTNQWNVKKVVITGVVRYWKGSHPATTVEITIPWSGSSRGPAVVTFKEGLSITKSYVCNYKSDSFREVTLEVDVVKSKNAAPLLPQYHTNWHNNAPLLTNPRSLDFVQCYREAGVKVVIPADRTVIDDSAATFTTWSDVELHDAMESHFSRLVQSPSWRLWGVLAGSYDNATVGGIMFDWSGAGKPPERQGFAVFRNHSWFKDLVEGVPASQAQAFAIRQFLYVWVHEAGHAVNYMHSWDKSRPDALSWMNYPQKYDDRNGTDSFWKAFLFRFDDEELIHLRHGDRVSVAMGGDAWATGTHMDASPPEVPYVEGNPPVDLLVRSKEYFGFLEPVSVELRLRNTQEDFPVTVDARLNPEQGLVTVYIRRPRGDTVAYKPALCRLAEPEMKKLAAADPNNAGLDRYSEEVFVSYGADGFYFSEPGDYLVRAVYHSKDLLLVSNTHRLRIGAPMTKDDDRFANNFYTYEVGASLYLAGSPSEHLKAGMDVLEEVAAKYSRTTLGLRAATTVASSAARTFHHVDNGKVTLAQTPDPKRAIDVTAPALEFCRTKPHNPAGINIAYNELVRSRAEWLAAVDRTDQAQEELTILRADLAGRGVKPTVLADIARFEQALVSDDGAS